MAYIEWLDSGLLPRAVVGGKAANLSELVAAGFTQTPGFALTAAAYRRVIAQNGLGAAAPETLAASLCEADLPHDLLVEIEQAELTLKGGDAVAVRSSAISEDGASASFAEVYDSYLNVRGSTSVERAVLRCYASLWAARTAQYRRERTGGSAHSLGERPGSACIGYDVRTCDYWSGFWSLTQSWNRCTAASDIQPLD